MTQRTVLITGGSRGIGAAIARKFAASGDRIALHYVSSEPDAQAVLDSLSGSGHMIAQADLRNPEAIRVMVEAVAAKFGKIDVLINNAGIFIDHPIETTTYEQWQNAISKKTKINLESKNPLKIDGAVFVNNGHVGTFAYKQISDCRLLEISIRSQISSIV